MNPSDSLIELFQTDLEAQSKLLSQSLIDLEIKPGDPHLLESSMRAAHSIKGAAKVISLEPIVRLAHAMEDCFVAAQKEEIEIDEQRVDLLLKGVDIFSNLAKTGREGIGQWTSQMEPIIESVIGDLSSLKKGSPAIQKSPPPISTSQIASSQEKVLRMTAESLNKLMGLAGESMVEARWLTPFGESLQKFKSNIKQLKLTFDSVQSHLKEENLTDQAKINLKALQSQIKAIYEQYKKHLVDLADFISRYSFLTERLYQEVLNSRMRPFADGVEGFARIVRDLGHELGKKVKLEIVGKATLVDRDILEKLESPLTHLLRNAISHGIETPTERRGAGKSEEGTIKMEAKHQGGLLEITLSDDGRGLNIDQLRKLIIEKKYLTEEMASHLTIPEVIDFLFLPGFSTSKDLTDISGRGVGLNVVQNTIKEIGGRVHATFTEGKGTAFDLFLPITLSVMRALLVEISGDFYAFPLSRIDRTVVIEQENIQVSDKGSFFHFLDREIALVQAWEILELNETNPSDRKIAVLMSDRSHHFGLVIDRLLGEKELVVQELDPQLGKVPHILAGSLLEDGSPVLILDVEDIVQSIKNFLQKLPKPSQQKKRILIIDDSPTVREFEARLLKNQGYEVEVAENGKVGINALKLRPFDLVITDLDMPRMDGISLLKEIRYDPKLNSLPVIIVSYKSTEEEQSQGFAAGATAYLSKNSFHDFSIVQKVQNLLESNIQSTSKFGF